MWAASPTRNTTPPALESTPAPPDPDSNRLKAWSAMAERILNLEDHKQVAILTGFGFIDVSDERLAGPDMFIALWRYSMGGFGGGASIAEVNVHASRQTRGGEEGVSLSLSSAGGVLAYMFSWS